LAKQVLVIGLGRFGRAVAETLVRDGCEVLGVDRTMKLVQQVSGSVTQAMQVDATEDGALEQIGARDFDAAVVAIGDSIEASVLAVANLAELGIEQIWAKAVNDAHQRILRRVGAHRVVFPEREEGERVGHALAGTNLIDYLELGPGYTVAEVRAPRGVVGHTLRDAQIRERFGVAVILIRSDGHVEPVPPADTTIRPDDILVVAGPEESVQHFSR
jgi:trk system potassium uptake protein TrkA